MKNFLKNLLIVIATLGAIIPAFAFAARTDALWDFPTGTSYIKPNGTANGNDLLLFGSNHYLNFGSASGVNGYGFRDNAGAIEVKSSGGSWSSISGGGSSNGTVSTSSAETSGLVPFWTSTGASPATLSGGVAGFAWNNALSKLTATNLSFTLATGTSATTTNLFSTNAVITAATTTNLSGTNISGFGLSSCAGTTNALTWTGNSFGCNTISAGGTGTIATSSAETSGRIAFWTSTGASPATLSGGVSGFSWNDTLKQLTATNFLGTTATVTSATTTNFAIIGLSSTFLAVDANGSVVATTTPTNIGGASQGVNWTTAAVLSGTPTYANGTSGVGATLTEVGTGALSVDSNSPAVGDRVLVKNQASAFQNGIYSVTATGSGIASYILTRATDYNTATQITPGLTTYVISGTANTDTTWAVSYTSPLTIGTTNLTYTELSGGGAAVASVSNADSTLTISPTSGAVVASLNLAHANTWTGGQTFGNTTTTNATTTSFAITGKTSCTGGSALQTTSTGGVVCGTVTATATIAPIMSDYSDGTVTISATTTLTRDMYYDALTINAGVTLSTGGFRIFARTVTVNGTLSAKGGDGGNGQTAPSTTVAGVGGTAGTLSPGGTLPAGIVGQVGGAGNASTAEGAPGIKGTDSSYSLNSNNGAAGGTGSGGSSAGGTAGIASSTPFSLPRNAIQAYNLFELSSATTTTLARYTTTPGAGSGAGGKGSTGNSAGGGGGGSGATGGTMFVSAETITVGAAGTITVAGGIGGTGGNSNGSNSQPTGGGGGGGGGNGGAMFLLYNSLSNSGTITAAAGTGGAGGIGQSGGGNGSTGGTGTVGKIFQITS